MILVLIKTVIMLLATILALKALIISFATTEEIKELKITRMLTPDKILFDRVTKGSLISIFVTDFLFLTYLVQRIVLQYFVFMSQWAEFSSIVLYLAAFYTSYVCLFVYDKKTADWTKKTFPFLTKKFKQ